MDENQIRELRALAAFEGGLVEVRDCEFFRVIHSFRGSRNRNDIIVHICDSEVASDSNRYFLIAIRADLSKAARNNGGSTIEDAIRSVQWSSLD